MYNFEYLDSPKAIWKFNDAARFNIIKVSLSFSRPALRDSDITFGPSEKNRIVYHAPADEYAVNMSIELLQLQMMSISGMDAIKCSKEASRPENIHTYIYKRCRPPILVLWNLKQESLSEDVGQLALSRNSSCLECSP